MGNFRRIPSSVTKEQIKSSFSVRLSVTNAKTQINSSRLIFVTNRNFGLWHNYPSPVTGSN